MAEFNDFNFWKVPMPMVEELTPLNNVDAKATPRKAVEAPAPL